MILYKKCILKCSVEQWKIIEVITLPAFNSTVHINHMVSSRYKANSTSNKKYKTLNSWEGRKKRYFVILKV
ncbi:hypothetical protein X975_06887, partial [Stegodyphus mimosarum]